MQEATNKSGRRQTRSRGRRLFAGYVRVSSVGAREDERLRSPEFQAELIDRAAREHGVDVRLFEAELDVSGSKRQRATLDSIIEAIEAGELDGIIVAKLDRLSRLAPRDRLEVVERIEQAGGVILSASEAFDTSSPEGRFVRELFFSIARLEWERYRDNWTTAKRSAIAAGVVPSGRRPFGYRFDAANRLVVDRAEAKVVVELFELRAGGASWTTLLERYQERTGRRTARQTMSRLVRSRTYLGELAYGELVNVDAHEAIVELDLFETVQRVNGERAGDEHGRRHAGAPVSELGGIAVCEGCRRPMVKHSRSHQRDRYECPSPASQCPARASIVAEELNELVERELLAWAAEAADETIELELERESVGDRVVAEHRLAEAERVALDYELNVELELEVGRDDYQAGRQARRELVELRRQELDAIGEASELEVVRTTLRQAWPTLETADRRRLIGLVVESLVVRRAPRAPIAERVSLELAVSAEPSLEQTPELLEDRAA